LERRLDGAVKAVQSARIPVSLERFDRWFQRFSKSQIARIVLLDLAFPFIFGAFAIGLSVQRMITIYASG
jgi:hypothetical protein